MKDQNNIDIMEIPCLINLQRLDKSMMKMFFINAKRDIKWKNGTIYHQKENYYAINVEK